MGVPMAKTPAKTKRSAKKAAAPTFAELKATAAEVFEIPATITDEPPKKPVGATLRKMTKEEMAALGFAFGGAGAAAPKPAPAPRKQTTSPVSSLASRVMKEPIDQNLWNRVRNDEQAFYQFARERLTLAGAALSNDETPGQE